MAATLEAPASEHQELLHSERKHRARTAWAEDPHAPVHEERVQLAHGHVVPATPVELLLERRVRAERVGPDPGRDLLDRFRGHRVAALAVGVVR